MKKFTLTCLLLTLFILNVVADKISHEVTLQLQKSKTIDVVVLLKKEINYETLFQGKENLHIDVKAQIIVDNLMILSKTSQKKLLKFLQFKKLAFEALWISNAVSIKGIDKETIEIISENEEVKEILLDKFIGEDPLENSVQISVNSSSKADIIEPNMKWINADKAWANGHKGKDIIIAFSDSGANYQHPGVVHAYLGKNGNSFDHNYHWFDPLFRSKTPIDTRDHGTHCMGSALGGKNVNRKIGVAPEAKWTHCHRTSTATVHKCLQWFLAPTNLEDKNPQVSKRPHITSHSYLCNGCGLDRATEALIQAGVHFVNAAGNSGPRCNSVVDNAKMKDQITVAALAKGKDTVTSFSSKGQGPFSGLIKPEVAAPGENIISASGRGEAYVSKSGTSMACPTVAGAIAVLWEAVPQLKRKVKETNQILFKSSKGQKENICGTNGSPNAAVGYGTIDVDKMIKIGKQMYSK